MGRLSKWIVLFILLSISCKPEIEERGKLLLLSDPFPNRTIDNGKTQLHNSDCVGFFKNSFSPSLITSKWFEPSSIVSLIQETGIEWRYVRNYSPIINFDHFFPGRANALVYVAETVYVSRSETRILSVGSDDGFILFINGDSVACTHRGRNNEPHSDLIRVSLHEGSNVLLFKVDQGDGGWSLFREFISDIELREIIDLKTPDLYSDLPGSCILPDTATYLELKADHRRQFDSWDSLRFVWSDQPQSERKEILFRGDSFPNTIALPREFSGRGSLMVEVNTPNGETRYREQIPIFKWGVALELAKRAFADQQNNDPVVQSRIDAVVELFGRELGRGVHKTREYSTRMKAHALMDFSTGQTSGPIVMGYWSVMDRSIQTYRVFVPAALGSRSKDLHGITSNHCVFVMHGIYADSTSFWQSYEGTSHALMARRSALSTENQLILVMPHGRGSMNYLGDSREELPLILDQLERHYLIDTNEIGAIVWSGGTLSLLSLLESQFVPFSAVALVSPVVPKDPTEMYCLLVRINKRYPRLKWFIWQGLDDSDTPIHITRGFVEQMEELKMNVRYIEVPHATHWNYPIDPEREFYRTF